MQDRKGKRQPLNNIELPVIPDKLYFSIGEVAKLCHLKTHVLRYWEQEFPQINPSKRRNRRYYQRKDVLLIRTIRNLLYEQGFTIEGARMQLLEDQQEKPQFEADRPVMMQSMLSELETLLLELEEI